MALNLSRFAQDARLAEASENNPPLRPGETSGGGGILLMALVDLGYSMPGSTKDGNAPSDGILDEIVSSCGDQDWGGRMIDNMNTTPLLPVLRREFLNRSFKREILSDVDVAISGDVRLPLERPRKPGN